jgi:hypothetical protein
MARSAGNKAALLDLPLELLTDVCLQLNLRDLVHVAATCKHLRYGNGGLETVELPTKFPVFTVPCAHASHGGKLVPHTRPVRSESWVAYLSRCTRQVVTAVRAHAFPGGDVPGTRPIGCSESWVAYLARCMRQRRCREAPPFAVGPYRSYFVGAAGRLLACGEGRAVGHGDSGWRCVPHLCQP